MEKIILPGIVVTALVGLLSYLTSKIFISLQNNHLFYLISGKILHSGISVTYLALKNCCMAAFNIVFRIISASGGGAGKFNRRSDLLKDVFPVTVESNCASEVLK